MLFESFEFGGLAFGLKSFQFGHVLFALAAEARFLELEIAQRLLIVERSFEIDAGVADFGRKIVELVSEFVAAFGVDRHF
jgi:hypothetical protein